jgi:hypothetical protein
MHQLLSDTIGWTVKLPSSMPLDEVARKLYPGAFKEDRTPQQVRAEWGWLTAECANLKSDLRRAEENVAQGASAEDYKLSTRRRQVKIAEAVLQKMFNEACRNYFVDHACTWPAYVMSQDPDATSKDWHFFFRPHPSILYRSGWVSEEETSRAFGEHWDRLARDPRPWLRVYLGVHWHAAVSENAKQLSFTAPRNATNRPSSYEGNQDGAAEWAKRETVTYLKVCAKDVQAILERFKGVKYRVEGR